MPTLSDNPGHRGLRNWSSAVALSAALTLTTPATEAREKRYLRKGMDPAAVVRKLDLLSGGRWLVPKSLDAYLRSTSFSRGSIPAPCLNLPDNGLHNPVLEGGAPVVIRALQDLPPETREALAGVRTAEDVADLLAQFDGERGSAPVTNHVDFFDWDDDGDLDAFVGMKVTPITQSRGTTESVVYFENLTGEAESPFPDDQNYFAPVVGPDSPVNDIGLMDNPAPRLADLDGDGVPELYVGQADGRIRRYVAEMEGPLDPPRGVSNGSFGSDFEFLQVADARGTTDLDVGDFAVPDFVNIDGDGDFELFVGHKNNVVADPSVYLFEPVSNERGVAGLPLVWNAVADEFNPLADADVGVLTAPRFTDIDGDGDFDAFVGAKSGLHYFENAQLAPRGGYPSLTEQFLLDHPLAGAQEFASPSSPAFADIDGDGDLDFFHGRESTVFFVENRGTPVAPAFLDMGVSPEFADLDADGDLDVIAGGTMMLPPEDPLRGPVPTDLQGLFYFENVGSAAVPVWERRLGAGSPIGDLAIPVGDGLTPPSETPRYPDTIDIDGDGDLDLFAGDQLSQEIRFFENQGTPQAPSFVEQTGSANPFDAFNTSFNEVSDPRRFRVPDPFFVDVNGDGALDAVVGDLVSDGEDPPTTVPALRYFENTGTAIAPAFEERFGGDNPFAGLSVGAEPDDQPAPWLQDYDHDGDPDLFVGNGTGVFYYENTGSDMTPVFGPDSVAFWLANLTTTVITDRGTIADSPGPVFGSRAFPAVADIDGDGDFDGFVGAEGLNEALTQPGGLIVSPSEVVTSEAGAGVAMTVQLASQPLGDVEVTASTSDPSEATIAGGPLTFTPANWNVPQEITVVGVDDPDVDGDVAFDVIVRSSPSDHARGLGNTACAEVRVPGINVDQEARVSAVSASKSVSGDSNTGGIVTYTIQIRNNGPDDQPDLPGPEFEDELPSEVGVVSAESTSGSVAIMGNTVSFDGEIPAFGSVILTIDAQVLAGDGTEVVNQGLARFDADGDDIDNEASTLSDDPDEPGLADPTRFVVGDPLGSRVLEIPTVGTFGRWVLGAVLALFALVGIGRTRP